MGRSGGSSGPVCRHPLVGKQFGESALRMGTDAFEDVAQVGKRIDVQPLAGGDKAGQQGRRPPAVSLPKKSQFLRPTATPRRLRSAPLLSISKSPSPA